jgi:probable regulatory domain-containing protein
MREMSEVPLSPVGREEIHRLEAALLIASLFSKEAIEELRNPEGRLTWVDSLAVAAAALARERAKMPVSQIAEELGRTEATIRSHLSGRTKAGKLVRETYERFVREGVKIEVPEIFRSVQQTLAEDQRVKELEELRARVKELEEKVDVLSSDVEKLRSVRVRVVELVGQLESHVQRIKEVLEEQ